MSHLHTYTSRVAWSGSTAEGYAGYDRRHAGEMPSGGLVLPLSGDAAFGGDAAVPNPEQLLVLAAASCQLLSFLAVAARARIEVLHYSDDASGEMPDSRAPVGLTTIQLHPRITVVERVVGRDTEVTEERVRHLCEVAHRECYVANSLRTEVDVAPVITLVPRRRDTFRP
ncbi:MAG TPA: OsmC family protein [Frankiaceae bacterium]|nr:OsmC family protein [Frankiaceae bacterium]